MVDTPTGVIPFHMSVNRPYVERSVNSLRMVVRFPGPCPVSWKHNTGRRPLSELSMGME